MLLNNLEVLNGTMGIKFDSLVTYYTVNVSSDIERLELNYDVSNDYVVNVINNNNLVEGINFVYLEVIGEISETYTLEVYKDSSKTVIKEDTSVDSLQVSKEVNPGVYYLLFFICFLLILLAFKLIYKRK